jgi:acetyl esterase/lipase
VVVLGHGGAWRSGHNRLFGLYSGVGEFLASQGIAAVLPNYRLSPAVKHPEHVTDVARAVAWTHAHIAEYGGRPDQMFLAGHSAGAHLVSLLATDDKYLEAQGMRARDIRGVIDVSGVYRIPTGKVDIRLGGDAPMALRFDQFFPMRGESNPREHPVVDGIPATLDVFGPSFADDAKTRADASPIRHVRPGLPPFLVACAENDFPTTCDGAEEFYRALARNGCEATFLRVAARNHNSVFFRAITTDDPMGQAMLTFIRTVCARPAACDWKPAHQ